VNGTLPHRHGPWTHSHHYPGPHRHLGLPFRSAGPPRRHGRSNRHRHEHTHGRTDPSVLRSRAGVRAVAWSLAVLGLAAALQAVVFALSGSVALLADLVHNGGDALTAVPLGIAFILRSERGERRAGYVVVGVIVASAIVAGAEAVDRLLHPAQISYLPVLAVAGVVGFAGNEIAARVRLRAGRRLDSSALVADGVHARLDGLVSLGVVASAAVVALGFPRADPVIGLAITALILRAALDAWHTVRRDTPPG
jgi:cation diffusion facilitator family transporter